MIHIVLDTNILHQEGLESRNMQLLSKLSNSDELTIYVPEIVKREFISKRTMESQDKFTEAKNALLDISKKLLKDDPLRENLSELDKNLTSMTDSVSAALRAQFDNWAKEAKTVELKSDPAALDSIIDSYFSGTGAFRKAKNREDFPDAFVNQCIETLAKQHDTIYIAIKDTAFKKHLETIPNITLSDSLKDFFQRDELQAINTKIDGLLKNVEELKDYLAGEIFTDRLTEYLTSEDEPLKDVYIEEQQIDGINNLDIDSFGVSINYAQSNNVEDIKYSNPTYIEEGHYSLDIEIITIASIHYCASYMDYMQLSNQRIKHIDNSSMNGDGICDLAENFFVSLQGTIEIYFYGGWSVQELDTHSAYLNTDKSKIKTTLDIESGAILKHAQN